MPGAATAIVGLAALAAVTISGCGTAKLDTAKGERQIQLLVARYTGQQTEASCPRNVPLRNGTTTTCTVTAPDGSKATVSMVQSDDRGHVRVSSQLMHTAMVEQRIATDASRRLGFAVTIRCPQLVEITKGSQVRCKAADSRGKTASVYVRITDARGSFDYWLPPRRQK